MNRVELRGGLTRDSELKFTANGFAIFEAQIAVNGARYDGKERKQVVTTVFILVQAFGWLAEHLAEEAWEKGDEVYVVGEMDQSSFEDQHGQKQTRTRVTIAYAHTVRRRNPSPSRTRDSGSSSNYDDDPVPF